MNMTADLDSWDCIESFTAVEAAFLWFGWEPTTDALNDRENPLPGKVRTMASQIKEKFNLRDPRTAPANRRIPLGLDSILDPPWTSYAISVSDPLLQDKVDRASLVSYAESINKKPEFLFPEMRNVIAKIIPVANSNEKMQWIKARRIIRGIGFDWPDQLNIEQIAKLHFPDNGELERDLLSLLKDDIGKGDLVVDGIDRQEIRQEVNHRDLLRNALYNMAHPIYHEVPILMWETYRDWPNRPYLPDNSPLHGWIHLDDPREQEIRDTIRKPVEKVESLEEIKTEEIDRSPSKRGPKGPRGEDDLDKVLARTLLNLRTNLKREPTTSEVINSLEEHDDDEIIQEITKDGLDWVTNNNAKKRRTSNKTINNRLTAIRKEYPPSG